MCQIKPDPAIPGLKPNPHLTTITALQQLDRLSTFRGPIFGIPNLYETGISHCQLLDHRSVTCSRNGWGGEGVPIYDDRHWDVLDAVVAHAPQSNHAEQGPAKHVPGEFVQAMIDGL